ncbi:MAG: DUF167 domain-containing protein [Candidatus Pacearchaeota archaeon]
MILKIKVKPNSKEEKIEKLSNNEYKISVKEPAKDNKANIRIVNLLSKELNTNHKNIKIKNPTSRDKIIEIKTE